MDSREQVEFAISSLFEYLEDAEGELRWKKYDIIHRDDQGRYTSTLTIAIPRTQSWFENPPDEYVDVEEAVEQIVEDEEVQLIQSKMAATNALHNAVREAQIEANRKAVSELDFDNLTLCKRLYSQSKTGVTVSPIVGLRFEDELQLAENFRIREATDLEKELILNSRDLGGGSIATRRAIQHDSLSHLAAFEYDLESEDGWNQGMDLFSGGDRTPTKHREALRSALQMVQPSEFQLAGAYTIDKTFYPNLISSTENRGAIPNAEFATPEKLEAPERLTEYFDLILNANKQGDEGLRVAIDRLESSYRKVSKADAVVDAIIGIEALLSTDPRERFSAVRRRAAVLSGNKSTYSQLGHLQKIRNSTVHGSEKQVSQDDLDQSREVLSSVLSEVISMTAEKNCTREELIDTLDSSIEQLIQQHFEEAVSRFE